MSAFFTDALWMIVAYVWALGRSVRAFVVGSYDASPNFGQKPFAHSKLSTSAQWK